MGACGTPYTQAPPPQITHAPTLCTAPASSSSRALGYSWPTAGGGPQRCTVLASPRTACGRATSTPTQLPLCFHALLLSPSCHHFPPATTATLLPSPPAADSASLPAGLGHPTVEGVNAVCTASAGMSGA